MPAISQMLAFGAYLAAATSIVIGIFLFTTIPKNFGFYRWLTENIEYPILVGMSPASHHGIPWGYTWEEFYKQDFSGQTAIVTGANSGIGFDISMALAKVGTSVTMICRNPTKCEKARNLILQQAGSSAKVETMTMDTSSLASVQAFAKAYTQEHGTDQAVDMIFMNAGINSLATPGKNGEKECPSKTEDGIEYLFQVNYLSNHLLYRLLEPHLEKSKQVRIIHTSSANSLKTYSYRVATDLQTLHGCSEPTIQSFIFNVINVSYGQSKLAQILWVKALTRKLPPNSHVFANAFNPGLVDTQIIGRMMDTGSFPGLIRRLFDGIVNHAWQSPDGALTGLYLAVNPKGVRGKYFHPQAREVINPLSLDEQLQDDLWDFSELLAKNYLPLTTTKVKQELEEPPDGEEQDKTNMAGESVESQEEDVGQ